MHVRPTSAMLAAHSQSWQPMRTALPRTGRHVRSATTRPLNRASPAASAPSPRMSQGRPDCARARAAALAAALDPSAPDARLAARYRRQHQRERDAEQLLGVEGTGAQVPVRAELPSPPPPPARARLHPHIFLYYSLETFSFRFVTQPRYSRTHVVANRATTTAAPKPQTRPRP